MKVLELATEQETRRGAEAELRKTRVRLDDLSMSRHLRTLRRSGLVEEYHPDFDARVRVYVLRAEAMDELKQWLEETERMWAEQLAAFKAHLEQDEA